MRLRDFIFKQYDIGSWLGAIKRLYSGGMSYQGMWGIIISSTVLYNSFFIQPERYSWLIDWLEYWMLLAFLAMVLTIASWIYWAFEIPSQTRFSKNLEWKLHNPHRDWLFKMKKAQDAKLNKIQKEQKRQSKILADLLEEIRKNG